MVRFSDSRDALKARLDAMAADPDTYLSGFEAPKVYLGFPVNEPPFYWAVDEIVDDAHTSGAATMGHATWTYSLHVWAFAQHRDLQTAADTLNAYTDAIMNAVLVDQTLGGTVENCFPEIQSAGTSADSSKRYLAAAAISIRCTVFSRCPSAYKALV